MNITEIQAIIPVGFNDNLGLHDSPAELLSVDGISLLCHALGEVSKSGISKVLIVVTDVAISPCWVSPAIKSCERDLEALGLDVPQVEILFLSRCGRMDDAFAYAMSYATAPWAAIICPLLQIAESSGLSQVVDAAKTLDAAVIGVAETNWETAIQLCPLILKAGLARGVQEYCPRDDQQTVYAGRAVLPTMRLPNGGFGDGWALENETLLNHLISINGPLLTQRLQGPITDFRFQIDHTQGQIILGLTEDSASPGSYEGFVTGLQG